MCPALVGNLWRLRTTCDGVWKSGTEQHRLPLPLMKDETCAPEFLLLPCNRSPPPGWQYGYDGDGNRVTKCNATTCTTSSPRTLSWYGNGSSSLAESTLAGKLDDDLIFFNGQRIARWASSGAKSYFFADHLGSIGVVTDSIGNCLRDSDYYPYGGEITTSCNADANAYKFTGKKRDTESGLDYFPARYLGSSMGRWMSPDPIPWLGWQHPPEGSSEEEEGESLRKFEDWIGNPQNLNMYAYVNNNPLRYTDPTGMAGCQAGDKKFTTCTITVTYDPNTSKGTLTVTGMNKGDKEATTLLKADVVVGGDGHVTPTGTFTATSWEKDHVSTLYGNAANTPWSKTALGGNAFGPYQLHLKELDGRGIFIHGTMGPAWSPTTWGNRLFLSPTSHGCIRMCNRDDIDLHRIMPNPAGNKIIIGTTP